MNTRRSHASLDTLLGSLSLVLAFAPSGCTENAGAPSGSAVASGGAAAASAGALPAVAKPKKNPDSAVIKAADAVGTACKWSDGGFDDSDCAALVSWKDKSEEMLGEGKADADLVALLFDERPGVRELGADGLAAHGKAYKTDPTLAGQILTAAAEEKDEHLAADLGSVVAEVNYAATKLSGSLRGVLAAGRPEMRARVYFSIGSQDIDDSRVEKEIAALVIEASSAPETSVRKAALQGLGFFDKTPEVCAALVKGLADEKDDLREVAVMSAPQCDAAFDAILTATEKAKKPISSMWYPSALAKICQAGSADQKKRAQTLAHEITTTSESEMTLVNGLRAVHQCDPAAGVALAKTLASHDAEYVRENAKKIAGGGR